MLRWERGRLARDWGDWEHEWYQTLIDSEGFEPPGSGALVSLSGLPRDVRAAIRASMPYYERLHERRLRV